MHDKQYSKVEEKWFSHFPVCVSAKNMKNIFKKVFPVKTRDKRILGALNDARVFSVLGLRHAGGRREEVGDSWICFLIVETQWPQNLNGARQCLYSLGFVDIRWAMFGITGVYLILNISFTVAF